MGIEYLSENVLLVCLPKEPQLSDELVTVNEIVSDGCARDVIIDFSIVELLTSESISSLIILERLLTSLDTRSFCVLFLQRSNKPLNESVFSHYSNLPMTSLPLCNLYDVPLYFDQ